MRDHEVSEKYYSQLEEGWELVSAIVKHLANAKLHLAYSAMQACRPVLAATAKTIYRLPWSLEQRRMVNSNLLAQFFLASCEAKLLIGATPRSRHQQFIQLLVALEVPRAHAKETCACLLERKTKKTK